MQFDIKPKVTFLDRPEHLYADTSYIPYSEQIDKIYLGYRQCYSKDPFKRPTLSREHTAELYAKFKDYYQSVCTKFPELQSQYLTINNTSSIIKYRDVREHLDVFLDYCCTKHGTSEFTMFLHKCDFIRKHMMHTSPLEHGTLTVQISGASRVFSHQWVRARIATHSQQSTRYVAEDPDHMEFITPPSVAANPEAMEAVKGYLEHLSTLMKTLADCGITREDIRMYYPHCIPVQIVTTMNFHNWMHTLGERCCSRTSYEIRYVAKAIQKELMWKIPFVFENLGPKCEKLGYCPEHKGCGHKPSKEEIFKK